MKPTLQLASIALLAVAAATPVWAADRGHAARTRDADRFDHGMQVVANGAGQGEPGYGWRYFSDPAEHRAVVISPQGEYYLSRGKGLRLVAATQRGA